MPPSQSEAKINDFLSDEGLAAKIARYGLPEFTQALTEHFRSAVSLALSDRPATLLKLYHEGRITRAELERRLLQCRP